jgi:formimidoylglutamate deiminase
MIRQLFASHAWLPEGWANDVLLEWDAEGSLQSVVQNAVPPAAVEQQHMVLPGMINLHSHAFQRAMGGLTERAGDGPDSFWTWRDLMYRFARHITPDHMAAIAAQLYAECLRHGYTSVCEFHYIHRQPDGAWYPRMANCAEHILQGARQSGIGITMLPVLYSWANFGEQPLRAEQNRFQSSVDDILRLVDQLGVHRSAQVEVGAAPHSLRAASIGQIRELLAGMPAQLGLSPRWTLVHATHLSEEELKYLAGSGAVAGLCPTTEANLGDGLFTLPEYMAQHGRFGIGSDSHVSTSPVEELRWLEYGQRLSYQRRNISLVPGQKRVADGLWQRVGSLEPGKRADLLVLDADHPNLFDSEPDDRLARWLFSGNDNLVRDVMVGGQWKVRFGRHVEQPQISANYRATLAQLGKLRQHAA